MKRFLNKLKEKRFYNNLEKAKRDENVQVITITENGRIEAYATIKL